MINKKSLIALAVAVGILAPAEIMAHATFPKKDSYFTPDGRSYLEGTSSELALNLAHACGADTGTIITTLAFPNGGDGPDEVYDLKLRFNANNANLELAEDPVPSSLTLADALTGDALSGIKPRVDGDWHEIVPKPQGATIVHSIHWHSGWVPNNFYERVNFNTSFAKFNPESCVTKVRVYLPAIQYCATASDGAIIGQDYWLWKPVPSAGIEWDDIGEQPKPPLTTVVNRAPYIDIDRDLENNPVPKSCRKGGKMDSVTDYVIGAYPSEGAIATYLIHGGGGGGGGNNLICDDGSPANPPDHVTHHDYWCTDGSTPHPAP